MIQYPDSSEDHLHFLAESLAKLLAGDDAYIKPLAAELRVLACYASGTEGLLLRVIDELKIHDAVHVHFPGNLDWNHPLARGLQFWIAPIDRAGEGDPRIPPEHFSLKDILKIGEALVVSGLGYTHQQLIRNVAEQMGSAHEDDGAAPHLIELNNTIVGHRSALCSILINDADLVLEVGERTVAEATTQIGYVRRDRPAITLPTRPVRTSQGAADDFLVSTSGISQSGTVAFVVTHQHPDWTSNGDGYDFGEVSKGPLRIKAFKHPDKTMELFVEGLGESHVTTRASIPNTNGGRVMVAITWDGREAIFYYCGERIAAIHYH